MKNTKLAVYTNKKSKDSIQIFSLAVYLAVKILSTKADVLRRLRRLLFSICNNTKTIVSASPDKSKKKEQTINLLHSLSFLSFFSFLKKKVVLFHY